MTRCPPVKLACSVAAGSVRSSSASILGRKRSESMLMKHSVGAPSRLSGSVWQCGSLLTRDRTSASSQNTFIRGKGSESGLCRLPRLPVAVCEQAEWQAMEKAKRGMLHLVREGIPSEAEAELLARGA